MSSVQTVSVDIIPCSERMPPPRTIIHFFADGRCWHTGVYYDQGRGGSKFRLDGGSLRSVDQVSHWAHLLPLPGPKP